MKKYLITGGAGFIGSHFVDLILEDKEATVVTLDKMTYAGNMENISKAMLNPRHVFVKGDICDTVLVNRLFGEYDFDYVVNFAAESHVDRSINESAPFVRTNFTGVHVLLEAALANWNKIDGKRFVQISTDEVYGALEDGLYADEGFPLRPGNPYSATKASADLLALSYYNTYGLPVIITRCCNNFGPRQYPEKLIPLMLNNMIHKKNLPVYGDGKQIREWIYVKDHCMLLAGTIAGGLPGEIYNIGTGESMTNIELVELLIKTYESVTGDEIDTKLIKHVDDRKGHDRRYALKCEKIKRICEVPDKNFAGNLMDTIKWYGKVR